MASESWQVWPGEGWGTILLGQTPPVILAALQAAGVDYEFDVDVPEFLSVDDVGFELLFSDEADDTLESILRQISSDDSQWKVGGREIVGQPLDGVLQALGIAQHIDTVWHLKVDPYLGPQQEEAANRGVMERRDQTATATQLLSEGLLWSPAQGFGIQMRAGRVEAVFLRKANQVSREGYGPLTSEQLELARSNDLEQRLMQHVERRRNVPSTIATAQFAIALGVVVYVGYQNQNQWMEAAPVPGKVVRVESTATTETIYTIAYQDHAGQLHHVRWRVQDMYVPKDVGETVDVVFLPAAPDKPLGPARLRDMGFLNYAPWLLGVAGSYAVTLLVLQWLRK